MELCGEYVRFEKVGFSCCCGGRESRSGTIGYVVTRVMRTRPSLTLLFRIVHDLWRTARWRLMFCPVNWVRFDLSFVPTPFVMSLVLFPSKLTRFLYHPRSWYWKRIDKCFCIFRHRLFSRLESSCNHLQNLLGPSRRQLI